MLYSFEDHMCAGQDGQTWYRGFKHRPELGSVPAAGLAVSAPSRCMDYPVPPTPRSSPQIPRGGAERDAAPCG